MLSPLATVTEVMNDKTLIAVSSGTEMFFTATVGSVPAAVGVGVVIGVGSVGVEVTSKPRTPSRSRSRGVRAVALVLNTPADVLSTLSGSLLRLRNSVESKVTAKLARLVLPPSSEKYAGVSVVLVGKWFPGLVYSTRVSTPAPFKRPSAWLSSIIAAVTSPVKLAGNPA